jgi:lysozyme family protein
MSFDNALRIVLQLEGGYSNDPFDRGGATNYGIVQATYNDYNKTS